MDAESAPGDISAPTQLQARLVSFAVAICRSTADLPVGRGVERYAGQVIRSAGSVAANCAEARAAESRRDFIHKVQVCLKELRETAVWLEILRRLNDPKWLAALADECDELTRVFVRSIKTARR